LHPRKGIPTLDCGDHEPGPNDKGGPRSREGSLDFAGPEREQ